MLAALMPLINFERLIEDLNQPGSGQSLRSESVWLYHGILPLRTVWNAREYGDDAASIKSLRELFSAKETFASHAVAVASPSENVVLCVGLKSWVHTYLQIPNIQLDVC
ncbi:uncharacterized protein BO96DRAFT_442379 [Aspergillus niger CBS 101883]|uniref:uncharacterized protein n=1 Tax=Aspergillus lacticoffeatus (strain CBS 101883) TaxID=1450533 RepID=UPI000D80462C|nr:uncharacterized protein BO96DRAFT_442379 [Aspergillus niger CBS 101883]PYH60418.1 hypothetical protein BO96DRAFT_442379 [Aspergillus niger CBS 101883]